MAHPRNLESIFRSKILATFDLDYPSPSITPASKPTSNRGSTLDTTEHPTDQQPLVDLSLFSAISETPMSPEDARQRALEVIFENRHNAYSYIARRLAVLGVPKPSGRGVWTEKSVYRLAKDAGIEVRWTGRAA
jgi:hypothetical protein